ncbi:MAG: polysaccharide deacetylase family protein [Holophagaceae bacterium]|nr:polysaccharide deacetylase family protein [Holophagaceae bacterium]
MIFLLMGLLACGKKEPPPAAPPKPAAALKPWTCQVLNGVLVVQGEVDGPMDLVLEGRSIRETHHASFGPVRWEMFRPPTGEVAHLRTAEGQVLARWRFGAAPRVAPAMEPRPSRPRPPEPSRPPEDALDTLRHQLAMSATAAPAEAAVVVPVLKAELSPPTRRRSLPEPSRPGQPIAVDVRAWPQPQPLPIPSPWPAPRSAPAAALPGAPLWAGAGEGFNLVRGPRAIQSGQRRMVLSFDGGSSDESAEEILDTLKARNVRTTIFLTGVFIQKFPDLVRRMEQEGHDLGNHTMNHPHFAPGMRRDAKWTKEKFLDELLSADRALYQVLGRPMDPYWRAPYGEQTRELREWAEEIGFRHVGWSEGADTLDWATSTEKSIYRSGDAVLARLHARLSKRDSDGLIVLMHLGSGRAETDRPSKKLGAFMDRARAEGWQFVKVGDYLEDLRKPAWNPDSRLAVLEQKSPRSGGSGGRAAMRR